MGMDPEAKLLEFLSQFYHPEKLYRHYKMQWSSLLLVTVIVIAKRPKYYLKHMSVNYGIYLPFIVHTS